MRNTFLSHSAFGISHGSPNRRRQPLFYTSSLKEDHCLSGKFLYAYVRAISDFRLLHLPDQWIHFPLSQEKRHRQELLKLIAIVMQKKKCSCLTEVSTHPSSWELEPRSYFPKPQKILAKWGLAKVQTSVPIVETDDGGYLLQPSYFTGEGDRRLNVPYSKSGTWWVVAGLEAGLQTPCLTNPPL